MSAWPPPSSAPAGWYHDPSGSLRYFDGVAWAPLSAEPSFGGAASARDRGGLARPLPGRAAVLGVAVIVASLLGARVVVSALIDLNLPFVAYVAVLAALGYGPALAFGLWATRRWGSGGLGTQLGLPPRLADLGWGALIWFAAVAAQLVTAVILVVLAVPTGSNVEGIDTIDTDRTYVAVVLVTAVVVAPIVEELLFRGVIQRGMLSLMPAVPAVVLQGIVFGAIHIDPALGAGNIGLAVVLSVVGVVLGAGALLLGRLVPVVVAHAIFNGIVLAIALSGVLDRVAGLDV